MPWLQRYSPTKWCDGPQMAIFTLFLRPVFLGSRVQHILELHSEFTLKPHHVYTVSQKKGATLTMAITLSIFDRFAKFFHYCKEQ